MIILERIKLWWVGEPPAKKVSIVDIECEATRLHVAAERLSRVTTTQMSKILDDTLGALDRKQVRK